MAGASSWYRNYFFFFAGFFAAFFVAMSTPPPFDFKMVITYLWYSRVCAASKTVSAQFLRVGGNRRQPLCCASRDSGDSRCEFLSTEE